MPLVLHESFLPFPPARVHHLLAQGAPLPPLLAGVVPEPRQSVPGELWAEVSQGAAGLGLKHYHHLQAVPGGCLLRDELVVVRSHVLSPRPGIRGLREILAMRHRSLRLLLQGRPIPSLSSSGRRLPQLPLIRLHGGTPFGLLLAWHIDVDRARQLRPPPLGAPAPSAEAGSVLCQIVLVRQGMPLPWRRRHRDASSAWAESWLLLPARLDPERAWSLPEPWEVPGVPAPAAALWSRQRRVRRARQSLARRGWSGPRLASIPLGLESTRLGLWTAGLLLDPLLTGTLTPEVLRWPRLHGGDEDGSFFELSLADPDGGPSLCFAGGPGPAHGPPPPAWGPPHLVQCDPLRDRLQLVPFSFSSADLQLRPVGLDRCDGGPRVRRLLGETPRLMGAWSLAPGSLALGPSLPLTGGSPLPAALPLPSL